MEEEMPFGANHSHPLGSKIGWIVPKRRFTGFSHMAPQRVTTWWYTNTNNSTYWFFTNYWHAWAYWHRKQKHEEKTQP